ncbi:hypothetical protein [Saccharopolyspora rosea]|uniref:Uncharacterized protein n=1 Tax=Saccharopolyspora rosea TaxID=524884 RepID=A0ABW3G351_9PSEU|nr:hypothetical protein [Saccharopolyspora rosea]
MLATRCLRVGLVLLALIEGIPSLWAALAPLSFYRDFPTPDRSWLTLFPPYNEHMTHDFGLIALQFVVVLGFAAVSVERRLVRVVLIASLVFNVPHCVYHQRHLVEGSDVHVQFASQVVPIVLAVVLLVVNERRAVVS